MLPNRARAFLACTRAALTHYSWAWIAPARCAQNTGDSTNVSVCVIGEYPREQTSTGIGFLARFLLCYAVK
jgi:hypothetical protein